MVPNKKNATGGAPDPSETGGPAPSFEQALERLEIIVEELESGSLSLEDSIARYEGGIKLSQRLTVTLNEAEKRIERLLETPSGEVTTTAVDLDVSITEVQGEGGNREAAPGEPPSEPHERRRRPAPDVSDELPF